MICYRDMTFCSANCIAVACHRNKAHVPTDFDCAVAWADLSHGCVAYTPPPKAERAADR